MIFQKTPIQVQGASGHVYRPLDFSPVYRAVFLLKEDAKVQEGDVVDKEFFFFEYAEGQISQERVPLTAYKKAHVGPNDRVYDEKGALVAFKPKLLFIMEEWRDKVNYTSPPVDDKDQVEMMKSWLEAHTLDYSKSLGE